MRIATIPAAVVLAALLIPCSLLAQGPTIGVRGGLSVVTFGGSDANGAGNEAAFAVGGFATLPLVEILAFQPELLYAPKGAKWDIPQISSTGKVKLFYLELPLLARINIPMGPERAYTPYLVAGPYFGLKARCQVSVKDQNTTITTNCNDPLLQGSLSFRSVDAGATFGVGTNVRIGHTVLVFDGRYDVGMTQIDGETPRADVKNRALSFTIGVRLYPPPGPPRP